MAASLEECGRELLDVALLVMRALRSEMRQNPDWGLSMMQFRMLFIVRGNPSASLSDVAARVGLALPSASHAVDGLVERGLLVRRPCEADRRRVELTLTPQGGELLAAVRQASQDRLVALLEALSEEERERLVAALRGLRGLLEDEQGRCRGGACA